jgi:hypothetical protein
MIMRQYDTLREKDKDNFSYRNMKPVHIIVLIESSTLEFKHASPHYMHHREVSYDSGIHVPELSEVVYISLDTFQAVVQNKIETTLDAWLTLLSARDVETVLNLVEKFPEFLAIYQELAYFRKQPKELISMFSDALAIMDRNTEAYMVEEAKKEAKEAKKALEDFKKEAKKEAEETKKANQKRLEEYNQKVKDVEKKLRDTEKKVEVAEQAAAEAEKRVQEELNKKDLELAALKEQLAALQNT